MNGIGIASLMTGDDRIFNVTCDFTHLLAEREVKPREALADAASTTVIMSIFRKGKPVTTVSLGEELELRWTAITNKLITEASDEANADNLLSVKPKRKNKRRQRRQSELGFFVDSCTAERLDGEPPDPSPLPLIVDG